MLSLRRATPRFNVHTPIKAGARVAEHRLLFAGRTPPDSQDPLSSSLRVLRPPSPDHLFTVVVHFASKQNLRRSSQGASRVGWLDGYLELTRLDRPSAQSWLQVAELQQDAATIRKAIVQVTTRPTIVEQNYVHATRVIASDLVADRRARHRRTTGLQPGAAARLDNVRQC